MRVALRPEAQTTAFQNLDQVHFQHCSLPELNLNEIQIESSVLDRPIATPFYISGMTAGHNDAHDINFRLAQMASERGWIFGLGSQRRELDEAFCDRGIEAIVSSFSDLKIVSNLGISQLIELYLEPNPSISLKRLDRILNRSRAFALAIHLNPLQEAIQPEGTPNFKHGFEALEWLTQNIAVPVIVKETGSGMSLEVLQRLSKLKLFAVDVSGMGGTHWGRVEGLRADSGSTAARLGTTFQNWGISTLESVQNAIRALLDTHIEIWGSGGVRTGLDAAKLLALGCDRVGFAQPALQAALSGDADLQNWMKQIEQELKVAMFCSGVSQLGGLKPQILRIEAGK